MARPGNMGCWRNSLILPALVLALPNIAAAQAVTGVEYRDFSISVDGKECGYSQISVTTQDNGMAVMTAKASVVVTKLVIKVTYDVQATEWWKDGQLSGFKARVNDNGKVLDVQAALDGNTLRLRAGAAERVLQREVWVNSFWKLPDPRFFNKTVPVLDGDTGKEYNGALQYVGEAKVTVSGQALKCYHFRVTGGTSPEELWFDESHRLVRREFEEQRSRIVIQLTNVRR
jgi:uncharacterized protein DUF6134